MMYALLWSYAIWLMAHCRGQPVVADYYLGANLSVTGDVYNGENFAGWSGLGDGTYTWDGNAIDSQIVINVTQQDWGAVAEALDGIWRFPSTRPATLRFTLFGGLALPADADLVISA